MLLFAICFIGIVFNLFFIVKVIHNDSLVFTQQLFFILAHFAVIMILLMPIFSVTLY